MRTPSDRQTKGLQPANGRSAAPVGGRYEVGAVLSAKYRLEALLGEGGMGAVWRATNLLLDLPVAIKLIRADLDRGELRARLQLEARSAAKLGHPAIVRVYDVGESESGDPFIVMEHLQGETLAQLLAQGRLPATRAVQLLLPIIDALAMAHGRGIVHRDLKPDNLMIAREEQQVRPKILDFGIAKLTDPRDVDHKLTEAGAVVGSPEYMSPEQARGCEDLDASTDIWSTSVVLYEALTGSVPFSANNYNALLRSIVEDEPKPLSEYGAGDAELWQIVRRGLAKDRAQRYAKIADLGRALAGWLIAHSVTEDASGSSLDSKWFGRTSDPLGLGEAALTPLPTGQAQPRPTHESIPDSTGIARGPFTATVLPVASGRTLTLGAIAAGCALLGLTLFALGHSSRLALPRAPAAAAIPHSSDAAVPRPILPAPLEPAAPTAQKIEVWPAGSAQPEASNRPPTPPSTSVRASKPAAVAPRAVTSTTSAATSVPNASAAVQKTSRSLDLLAPY